MKENFRKKVNEGELKAPVVLFLRMKQTVQIPILILDANLIGLFQESLCYKKTTLILLERRGIQFSLINKREKRSAWALRRIMNWHLIL